MERTLDTVPVSEWGFFDESIPPIVIAGPCSAESELQIMMTAKGLSDFGIHVFRAGIWKPRTHPGSFEGVGVSGLKWLQKVKRDFGMKVCTEVASERHVYECMKYGIDMVWIGARTTANPFLVQEIAEALRDTDIPVLVKNPVNPDIDLWVGALERLNRAGIKKLGVIHRGFSTTQKIPYRNLPGWQMAVELRTMFPQIPFFADPSHMGGSRNYLKELSQRAMDLGLDGLMVESHCDPSCALSDSAQQIVPADLQTLLESLTVRQKKTNDKEYNENIEQLRARIDVIDENLLLSLASRMEISNKIGEFKKAHNIAIVQAARWDEILSDMIAKGRTYGLPEDFVTAVFTAIHDASVAAQNRILEGD
ncbi:MAG: bifunctional 3-deoxy-7-phosphoheptulonate synthase/chorismate mutase type II [Bacteroidales bacterium]|nr:bifunctional 3-deoxy-7-phosphoheptulonate synthase/chorismate mutase type II [Bacteroidales bacterium]